MRARKNGNVENESDLGKASDLAISGRYVSLLALR